MLSMNPIGNIAAPDTALLRQLQEYDWTGWTEWMPFLDLDFKKVKAEPGAYVLSTTGPINRAIGTDPMGILDIGEAGKGKATLQGRLKAMRRCMTKRGDTGHMAAWRFAFFRFERHYPHSSLRIRWIPAETKKAAQNYEGRVMLTYLLRHSELPPLNYQFNWQPFKEIGWRVFDDPTCFGRGDRP
jgi:hypothetical protein